MTRAMLEAECRALGYEPEVDDSDEDLRAIIAERRRKAA